MSANYLSSRTIESPSWSFAANYCQYSLVLSGSIGVGVGIGREVEKGGCGFEAEAPLSSLSWELAASGFTMGGGPPLSEVVDVVGFKRLLILQQA